MGQPLSGGEPVERIAELLQGAYDIHVHVSPDLVERSTDDLSLARRFIQLGWKGFVLKSHYFPTVERARVVTTAVPGIQVFGGLTLNHAVGGFNPVAVDVAGRAGARVVWMPTVDAANESPERHRERGESRLPFWAHIQREIRERGIAPPLLTALDEEGRLRPEVRACLECIAQHDMVLATGHLSRDEIIPLVAAARDAGVRRIVVTHALFPSQNLSIEDQVQVAGLGAYIEHCYTTFHTGKCAWETLYASIRAVGAEKVVLSSDLGQKTNPGIVEGLVDFAEHLLEAGFSPDQVRCMMVENPTALVEPDGLL